MDWTTLKKYDGNPPEKALPRKVWMNVKYGQYKKKLKEEGKSINSHIIEFLVNKPDRFFITYNKFPYDLAKGIHHLVVWVNPMYTVSEEEIRSFIESTGVDYILFANKPKHKSISDIDHYQLFLQEDGLDKLSKKTLIGNPI